MMALSSWAVALVLGAASPDPAFPRPSDLQPAVAFWTDVFWQYETNQEVLHDRENLGLVWQVIDLPRDSKGNVASSVRRSRVKAAKEKLQDRLRRLAQNPEATDDIDRHLLQVAGGAVSPTAANRIRSQRGVADNFRAGLERARPHLPALRAALAEQGVPTALAALPFVESMFNPSARSSAGAAGLWQLMPATARGLGLTVKRGNDERMDIPKATRAAARMLADNHRMLGNWPLAITGYNHGPYGIKRATKAHRTKDLMVLIRDYKKRTFGFASKNFYAEFLAAKALLEEWEHTTTAERMVQ